MDVWQWAREWPHLCGSLQCTCSTDTAPVRHSEGGSTQTVEEREKERERAGKELIGGRGGGREEEREWERNPLCVVDLQ